VGDLVFVEYRCRQCLVYVELLCALLQLAVGCMLLCLFVWYVSGACHNPLEWSCFAVRMMLVFPCNVALCLSKFPLYPASHSWPIDSRLLLRSSKTCTFLARSFIVGEFSFAVLHDIIVS
jgi:hypothetical protein